MSRTALVLLIAAATLAPAAVADELELTDGRKLVGQVLSQTDARVEFRIIFPGGGSADMTVNRGEIRSLKIAPLPTPAPSKSPAPSPVPSASPAASPAPSPAASKPPVASPAPSPAPSASPEPTAGPAKRTKAEMDALIAKAAAEDPDWLADTKLDYPQTMDLTWPDKSPGGWDMNRNISQYLTGQLNHQPAKYRGAIKFFQHVISVNKDNDNAKTKAIQATGHFYWLMGDWAHAAAWYRKSAAAGRLEPQHSVNLAWCYRELGCKEAAVAHLDSAGGYNFQGVRLLGEMGDMAKAQQLLKSGGQQDYAQMISGDLYRYAGQFKEAADAYKKSQATGTKNQRIKGIVQSSLDSLAAFEAAAGKKKFTDGTFTGEATGGFRGNMKVELVVKGGRIDKARVVGSNEDWPLNTLVAIPADIVDKQSVANVDTITGATFTSTAIINAAAKALSQAAK